MKISRQGVLDLLGLLSDQDKLCLEALKDKKGTEHVFDRAVYKVRIEMLREVAVHIKERFED